MSDYKEFQGKTLDIAIDSACDYFNCEREKLEIMLLEDAKTGVFGLFGARDAKISAKKADFFYAKNESVFEDTFKKKAEAPKQNEKAHKPKVEKAKEQKVAPKPEVKAEAKTEQKTENKAVAKAENKAEAKAEQKSHKQERAPKATHAKEHKHERKPKETREAREPREPREAREAREHNQNKEAREVSSLLSIEEVDQALLLDSAKRVTKDLISLIAEDANIECLVNNDRLSISIETEDSGLLIGKEGQTLASIEYLATRMLIKELNAHIRVQIEVGDYRSRQDSRLHDFALKLAARTRETGKSTSTRPLSSYQRRIVHLALQDMNDIQTRSIDEGPLKRVIISLAKGERH